VSLMSDVLGGHRVVPVVVLNDPAAAEPLGEALLAGGLPCAEVTFRTPAAEQALKTLAADPRLLVGAGTVLNRDQVDRAVAAGARFVVSPGYSPAVVRHCRDAGIPVLPGVATATEIMAALDDGVEVMKFFPAEQLGGVGTLRALAAVFTAVRFVPTGGITPALAPSYLDIASVAAVGGSWMVAADLIKAGAYGRIAELAAEAVALAGGSHAAS
jgi:2-dehydro-3-deoxyphosphogluconate aldolase / (4S)-4-hydroxy-2-oxoglutarate aldolase